MCEQWMTQFGMDQWMTQFVMEQWMTQFGMNSCKGRVNKLKVNFDKARMEHDQKDSCEGNAILLF